MKNSMLILAASLLFAGAVMSVNAQANQPQQSPSAQQPSATPTTPSAQQPVGQQSNEMQNSAATPMSGTIVKENGKLVLKDSATGTSYKLDDQSKAKQFEGKEVKVTGKLDAASNQIHVENIEPSQK